MLGENLSSEDDFLGISLSHRNIEIVPLLLDRDDISLRSVYKFTDNQVMDMVLEHPRVQEICQLRVID